MNGTPYYSVVPTVCVRASCAASKGGIRIDSSHPTQKIALPCGTLALRVAAADLPLGDLCGFASRRNRRRGFLFVSKVLGKHLPARPSGMRSVYARLAAKLRVEGKPALFMGLAETATGLGQGVFEEWLAQSGREGLFQHTTRHRFRRARALEFLEPHSHAPQHLLYWPDLSEHRRLVAEARDLVLIDDELSTGTTLANLALALRGKLPQLARIYVASLTNWMPREAETAFRARLGLPVEFVQLLRGEFDFTPRDNFHPDPPAAAQPREVWLDDCIATNFGRFGASQAIAPRWDLPALVQGLLPGARVLVLGTGEFHHPPFLLAEALERQGFDVHYQSTTRSPILVGGAIASACEFSDHYHEGAANYVYNVVDKTYDRILIGYEVDPLPAEHDLPAGLGAMVVSIT